MPDISPTQAAIYAATEPPVLANGTRVIQQTGWYQTINQAFPDASANEVLVSLIDAVDVDQSIAETFRTYQKLNLPFRWAIGPMSSPSLENKIAPHASTSWDFRGMSISTDVDIDLPASPDLNIELVNAKNFADFLEVNLSGWELSAFRQQTQTRLKRISTHPQYRCFLARKGDQAVGSAATILRDGFGYLISAVILEGHRGSGAYRALLQTRLSDLRLRGLGFAVTQAREATSVPILERIGFQTHYHAKIYRFDQHNKN